MIQGKKLSKKAKTHQLIETFKQSCRNFESRMSAALHLERLGSEILINESQVTQDNFLRHIQYCITGLNHPVNLPKNPIYLDALIGGQELTPGITPKIGRKFIQCVAIEGFPMESYPGILTLLTQLPVEYRWNSRFIFMDTHEAVAHFAKFRKKWKQKVRGFLTKCLIPTPALLMKMRLAWLMTRKQQLLKPTQGWSVKAITHL